MRKIELTQNKVAYVDDADFDFLNQYKWFAVNNSGRGFYAVTNLPNKPRMRMHRLIMNVTDPFTLVDHINHNGLDNRRSNLRICTHQENQRNRRPNRCSSSRFVGVSKSIQIKKGKKYIYWAAQIKHNGANKNLGLFPFTPEGEIQAAIKRDEAAKKMHGDFANLNFKAIEQYESK